MADDRSTQSSIKIPIDTTKDGNTLWLGDASDYTVGAMSLCFLNAADIGGVAFQGALTLVARLRGPASATDGAPWLPYPFRQFYLNGAPADGSLVAGGTTITGTSLIAVPLAGFVLGVQVNCAAGSGTLYKQPLVGPATP